MRGSLEGGCEEVNRGRCEESLEGGCEEVIRGRV